MATANETRAEGVTARVPSEDGPSGGSHPIEFTEKAREMVLGFIGKEADAEYAVRVSVENSSPLDPRYAITLVELDRTTDRDEVFDGGGFRVAVDPDSVELLRGARVEWVERLNETGFKVENPNLRPIGSEPLKGPLAERVRSVLEQKINPAVANHGGEIGLVEVRDDVVYICMSGGCQGCGMARVTLKRGVERMMKEAVPEISEIVDVTDHTAGENPYFDSDA